jgi:hypothetical protein
MQEANNDFRSLRPGNALQAFIRWESLSAISTAVIMFATLVQCRISSETSRRDMLDKRAWVVVNVHFLPIVENQPLDVDFAVHNTGRSPAENSRIYYVVDTSANLIPDKLVDTDPDHHPKELNNGSLGIIPPDERRRIIYDKIFVGKEAMERLTKQNVFVYGSLRYDDIYGFPHQTDYCFVKRLQDPDYTECPKLNKAQ